MTCGRSFDRGNNEVYKGGEGGPKLEGKRFEEVTRERFCGMIEMGVSS